MQNLRLISRALTDGGKVKIFAVKFEATHGAVQHTVVLDCFSEAAAYTLIRVLRDSVAQSQTGIPE